MSIGDRDPDTRESGQDGDSHAPARETSAGNCCDGHCADCGSRRKRSPTLAGVEKSEPVEMVDEIGWVGRPASENLFKNKLRSYRPNSSRGIEQSCPRPGSETPAEEQP